MWELETKRMNWRRADVLFYRDKGSNCVELFDS